MYGKAILGLGNEMCFMLWNITLPREVKIFKSNRKLSNDFSRAFWFSTVTYLL